MIHLNVFIHSIGIGQAGGKACGRCAFREIKRRPSPVTLQYDYVRSYLFAVSWLLPGARYLV